MDPNNDVIGSYGTGPGKKMYNHTCAEYEAGPVGQQHQRAESIEGFIEAEAFLRL
jgi:hypothetical protein